LFVKLGTDNLRAVASAVAVISSVGCITTIVSTGTITICLKVLLWLAVSAVYCSVNKAVSTLDVSAVTVIGTVAIIAVALRSVLKIGFAVEST
jgi:hypothetical protein